MKKMKKVLSLILTVVMVLAMAAPAMAATVTVTGEIEGHNFEAYQIFSGTQAENVEDKLGDVNWGTGINGEGFLAALKADADLGFLFAECTNALDVANALGSVKSNSETANKIAKLAYNYKTETKTEIDSATTELATGYYLIVDATKNVEEGDAYNAALLQVTRNIVIGVKKEVPVAEKKVQENSLVGADGYGDAYNDVADYNIGDDVPFKFTSKVPDMTHYDNYTMIFHDEMEAGFTLNDDFVVKIGDYPLSKYNDYEVKNVVSKATATSFEIEIKDLKGLEKLGAIEKGDTIEIAFTAKLNAAAEIGLPGNVNTMQMEYSNNPNESTSTGFTPEDKVVVFTYELDTTKIDGATVNLKDESGNDIETTKLAGAEFKLQNANGKWVTVDENGFVTGWVDDAEKASVLVSNENGLFKVIGLDEGTYTLTETKAPAGYNLLEKPIELVIANDRIYTQAWDGTATVLDNLFITVDGAVVDLDKEDAGVVNVTVANNMGAQLPSTGGIGTTIFYLVGILVMAGAVFFVIRSRKNEN